MPLCVFLKNTAVLTKFCIVEDLKSKMDEVV